MANLTFIPQATSKSSGPRILSLDEIPDEVKKDAEEVYEALKTNTGRMSASFGSVVELNTYVAQMKAYCDQRPNGAIKFRRSPTRNLPATTMEFRITDIPEGEQATDGIRDAVESVKDAAKK